MLNLNRLGLPKISKNKREELMRSAAQFITANSTPLEIIFFGSIISEGFDEASDIDLLLIYKTLEEADQARRKLYGCMQPKNLEHNLEMICVDQETFSRKSKVGGICFIALNEGIKFNRPNS